MARLGDLVARRLGGEEARKSFHLYESLAVLFRMVNDGHRARDARGRRPVRGRGLRFEALKADLFDPARTRLIGRVARPRLRRGGPGRAAATTPGCVTGALPVLRRLMLAKGGAPGRTPGQGPNGAGSSPTPSSASTSSARSTRG